MDQTQPKDASRYIVSLKDGYIDVAWIGHITQEMAAACNSEVYDTAKRLMDHDEAVRIRIRLQDPPAVPNTDAFTEGLKALKLDIPFSRIVFWGPVPLVIRALIDIIIETYKHDFPIRYIEDEAAALAWLLELPAKH